jgi:hypothetical protein
LPDLCKLKNIIDKFKNMAEARISISANKVGILKFEMSCYGAKVETEFTGLINPLDLNEDLECMEDYMTVHIDIRDLSRVLQCYLMKPFNVVCSISDNAGIVFHVYLIDNEFNYEHCGAIHYYVGLKVD